MESIQPSPGITPVTTSDAAPAPAAERDSGPIPMSFPAFLRTSGLNDRFAHLGARPQATTPPSHRRNKRDDKEGKRWVRRRENARFVGNAHIVAPSKKDFGPPLVASRATFPEPLPAYLARNNPVPPAELPPRAPASANAGRFSLSLKGMRRELRRAGPRTERLVREIEEEIVDWLAAGGVMLGPDAQVEMAFPGTQVGTGEGIREVARTPLQLVWSIEDDAFVRYVVHCCARYHDVVSFSKDTSGQRLTYLLRPNVTRPTRTTAPALDTPPTTDLSESSANDFDTESELTSDRDLSDAEGPARGPAATAGLVAIVEVGSDASAPASPLLGAHTAYGAPRAPTMDLVLDDSDWSVLGESDADGDLSAPEGDLASSLASLAVGGDAEAELEQTPMARRRQTPLRSRLLERQRRAASSPSRSPARRDRQPHRARVHVATAARLQVEGKRSFYDYLYS